MICCNKKNQYITTENISSDVTNTNYNTFISFEPSIDLINENFNISYEKELEILANKKRVFLIQEKKIDNDNQRKKNFNILLALLISFMLFK